MPSTPIHHILDHLETPGFAWDRDENVVHADEEAWNWLENEFANAYHLEREPLWKELTAILGPGRLEEGPNGVVAISIDEEGGVNDENYDNESVDGGSGGSNVSD
ncbi:hypothetical protein Salat_0503700 [Sesamum alatum]|uniref:Myb/SANT-like domain-containing protein n=1 Tax=Sesamum alatum TaxID=300844 RepID=A0AAE1Z595_9LAMI|nr:hypothetical protein Salat_0503700 [Sesamum alatum]